VPNLIKIHNLFWELLALTPIQTQRADFCI
jgi:hypothetical protein